jgi:deoxycytidine triphosphate deaminase
MCKTLESVKLPADVCGVVYPRSSTNRLGITLDMTGVVDANYEGHLILPLSYHGDSSSFHLLKGQRVASIMFHRLSAPVAIVQSKYHKTEGAHVPDKEEEQAYLEAGDIIGLKKTFSI